jgi:6-oxo-cyclohex-1-ene-carbonyl-CoA hydrolase
MTTTTMDFKNHDLIDDFTFQGVQYEQKPLRDPEGKVVEGLHTVWITLDNPKQYNSYTTAMVKGVIHGMRRASNDRACVAVIFTAVGNKAFCTGGNTEEYATYYAGRPEEYRQYMRLFNDMVTTIMHCDKPVICRVNGMRIAGGQEIGMACDFTVAQDLALFGQAGPRHGSAPDGGSTDFLPLFIGMERAMESSTLCEHWSAHKAYRLGLLTKIVPALKVNGDFVPNPLVHTDRWVDQMGNIVYGEKKSGGELANAKQMLKDGEVDLSLLDEACEQLVWSLANTMPGCLAKTRAHRLPRVPRGEPRVPRGRLPAAAPAPGRGRGLGRGADRGSAGQGPR